MRHKRRTSHEICRVFTLSGELLDGTEDVVELGLRNEHVSWFSQN